MCTELLPQFDLFNCINLFLFELMEEHSVISRREYPNVTVGYKFIIFILHFSHIRRL